MAKLSDLKKVELLEQAVLNKDVEEVKKILKEEAPIEFTAKAIGLACRFAGEQMVEALLDGGATLDFELTPALKRKYDCKIAINNNDDLKIDFTLFLFPKYQVKKYDLEIISDDERQKVLKLLANKNASCMEEILYYAILFNDEVILKTLDELDINEISEYRTDIVAGRVTNNRLSAYGRYDKREFQKAVREAKDDDLFRMLSKYSSSMKVDKIVLTSSDFYESDFSSHANKEKFITRFCSEELFDFLIKKTNFEDKVKKWDLLFALVDQNNAEGIQYALKKEWISKQKDIDTLLKYAQEKKNVKPELLAYILERQNQKGKASVQKEFEELSLSAKPISATELKKIWGTQKLEDGSLMITSYKGEDKDVIIPSAIGKQNVTAISSETFSLYTPRLSAKQKKARAEIVSVEFPGSIREIPSDMFNGMFMRDSHSALKRIIIGEGIEKLCQGAFQNCTGIEEISIPSSVRNFESYLFYGCSKLKKIQLPNNIEILPHGMFSRTGLEEFAVPASVKTLGEALFSECKNLKKVTLPQEMDEIPDGIFNRCTALSTFKFPKGISRIGNMAFAGCPFTALKIPDTVTTIDNWAFKGCKELKAIDISKDVELGQGVFEGCESLTNDKGQIVVNGTLFGVEGSNGIFILGADSAIKPLVLGDDISSVAVSRDQLPEIVYKQHSEAGENVDITTLSVGDEIYFGRFPNDEDYVMKPLLWRVIAVEGGKALLITVDNIINQSNELTQSGIWKDCWVRKLLNEGFYDSAFTEIEKAQIVYSIIDNPDNKSQRVDGGPNTKDRVFLLSIDEVEKYMPTEEDRKSTATEYACKQHPPKRDTGFWQLRTPGKGGWGSVAVSDIFGDYCAMTGNHVGYSYLRPAIWIKNV